MGVLAKIQDLFSLQKGVLLKSWGTDFWKCALFLLLRFFVVFLIKGVFEERVQTFENWGGAVVRSYLVFVQMEIMQRC